MAREIQTRWKISGKLMAESPLHVGGVSGGEETDLPLAQDGQGQWYIPGTSLAGAFRSWVTRCVEKDLPGNGNIIKSFWGYQPEKGSKEEGWASYIIIDDAAITLPGLKTIEVRDGVGIDRQTGAAADKAKYDRSVLPTGTIIPLAMMVEAPVTGDIPGFRGLIYLLINGLQEGNIRLGAAKTRGLGRVRLRELQILEQDMSTPEGMLLTLRQGGQTRTAAELYIGAVPFTPCSPISLEINWQPTGPILVKATHSGGTADMLPLTTAVDQGDQLSFVLPGSAIKGVLRSQAERIMRTVLGIEVERGADFLNQVEVPLVTWLFGSRNTKNPNHDVGGSTNNAAESQEQAAVLPGLGAVTVYDCHPKQIRFSREQWRNIGAAPDEQGLRQALDAAELQDMQQAFHVAIDRWTGGAADGALYSMLEPHGIAWEPIILEVDVERLCPEARTPALALLILVLQDLKQGLLPLGFGTNRGLGDLIVQEIRLNNRDLPDDPDGIWAWMLHGRDLSDIPELVRRKWHEYLKREQERHERAEAVIPMEA
jgi:CRISPR/Cas system CSM-associated protein Csm3 (group 7 of RAMP superfamily)